MVDGKTGTIYEDIIGKEVVSDKFISYVKEKDDKWKNQSIYLTILII